MRRSLRPCRRSAAALAGKILIDVTVPLVPPQVGRVQLPGRRLGRAGGAAMLGEGVRVVSAFQNVSAELLSELGMPIDCDVLVCGDDREARAQVIALAREAGMRALHAGPLANSVVAEALTSVLITINRQYKINHSGIAITGLPADSSECLAPMSAPKSSTHSPAAETSVAALAGIPLVRPGDDIADLIVDGLAAPACRCSAATSW